MPELEACPTKSDSLQNWIDSQRFIMSVWLDRLIAEGDPNDLISLIHRQAAWLELMKNRQQSAKI